MRISARRSVQGFVFVLSDDVLWKAYLAVIIPRFERKSYMIWKGKEIKTIGDLTNAVGLISSKEEGAEFMSLYRSENAHADENVGYVSGYHDRETMARIQEYCNCSHPIFGRSQPTTKEACEAGKKMGEAVRDR
jgi:hypothetical protein